MKHFWRNFTLVWLAYSVVMQAALFSDSATTQGYSLTRIAEFYFLLLPVPLILASLWPISGKLERAGLHGKSLIITHVFGSLLYIVVLYLLELAVRHFFPSIGVASTRTFSLWPLLYNMLIYYLHAFIFHFLRALQRQQAQERKMYETQKLLYSAELRALRSKLNPHFLFNTLHSIIALVRRDHQAAEEALFRFSDMLRYILETEKSNDEWVLLSDEIQFVRDYLELESLRLGSRLNVQWQLDEDALDKAIPALCIQPFIENSIKYAFNPRSTKGELLIKVALLEGETWLRICIFDDGPGCTPQQVERSDGIGIDTIRKRLQLAYGNAATMRIDTSELNGFKVELRLPANRNTEYDEN